MAPRRGVASAGTWCVDINKTIPAWPDEDTATEIVASERAGGGSGCNMATDLKRLDPDLPVEAMGLVGEDGEGRFLAAHCDALGIARGQLRATGRGPTHVTDCYNAQLGGRRTHLYYAGAGHLLTPDHFDFAASGAKFAHIGLPGVHKVMDGPWAGYASGWAAALRKAKIAGLRTNIDMVSATRETVGALGRTCLPYLDFLIVNDFEIGAVADVETRADGRTDVEKVGVAALKILAQSPVDAVVVHFPEGSIAALRGWRTVSLGSVALPTSEIAGVNGAGDAFAAGTLYGLHEGWEIEAAMRLGHAAAAASMREVPTSTGVLPVAGCLALADRWGLRPAPLEAGRR